MNVFYKLLFGVICLNAQIFAETKIQKPDHSIEVYSFNSLNRKSGVTEHFSIIDGKGGYSIKDNSKNKIIAKDIYYLKTFGGYKATISIHLINKRYIVAPRTITDSSIRDTSFNDHLATTCVYDLKTGKLLHETKPYRYNHDVPLKYDATDIYIWQLSLLGDLNIKPRPGKLETTPKKPSRVIPETNQ